MKKLILTIVVLLPLLSIAQININIGSIPADLRTGPHINKEIIKTIPQNTIVQGYWIDREYVMVIHEGDSGYIRGTMLLLTDNIINSMDVKHTDDALLLKESLKKKYNRPVKIGDTKGIVIEIMGAPDNKSKTESKYGVSEVWAYKNRKYIHFKDGKVEAINTYK
jgi:hypothetical protein